MKSRIYKFDNVKFICIILVVIGHMIDEFTAQSGTLRSVFLVIYSFHMPMFLFISGLFQKPFQKDSVFCLQKFTFFLVTGYLLKIATWLVRVIDHGKSRMGWFGGEDIPWFMMVLALYLLITYGISKLNVNPWIVLVLSFVLSGICGYFRFIGDFLWLSRLIVFLPFYLIGYYLTAQQVIDFTNRIYIRISSCILALLYIVLCFRKKPELYALRGLFTGRNAYSAVSIEDCGILHRYLCFLITVILCIALISLVPDRNIKPFTNMGRNTLSVFFWHRIIIYIFDYTGFLKILGDLSGEVRMIVIIVISILLSMVLMLDSVSIPLRKLQNGIQQMSRKGCLAVFSAILAVGIGFTVYEGF